ncbi:hypothetical protein D3C87_843490 [compost metagenome]
MRQRGLQVADALGLQLGQKLMKGSLLALQSLAHRDSVARELGDQFVLFVQQDIARLNRQTGQAIGCGGRAAKVEPTHFFQFQPAGGRHIQHLSRRGLQYAGIEGQTPGAVVIGDIEGGSAVRQGSGVGLTAPANALGAALEGLVDLSAEQGCPLDAPAERQASRIQFQALAMLGPPAVVVDVIVDLDAGGGLVHHQPAHLLASGDDGVALRLGRRRRAHAERQSGGRRP